MEPCDMCEKEICDMCGGCGCEDNPCTCDEDEDTVDGEAVLNNEEEM